MSFDLILPYLRPLAGLIADQEVSEIMVNADGAVFIERDGRLMPMEGVTIAERQRQAAVRNIARLLGDDIDEQRPLLDAAFSMAPESLPLCHRPVSAAPS